MIDVIYITIAIVAMVCYYIIKFTKIPVAFKDTIRITLAVVAIVMVFRSIITTNLNYLYGFVTAQFIYQSFDTSKDE